MGSVEEHGTASSPVSPIVFNARDACTVTIVEEHGTASSPVSPIVFNARDACTVTNVLVL